MTIENRLIDEQVQQLRRYAGETPSLTLHIQYAEMIIRSAAMLEALAAERDILAAEIYAAYTRDFRLPYSNARAEYETD